MPHLRRTPAKAPRRTPARLDPSYPRSPRVSRRAEHQAPFPPPACRTSATPAQKRSAATPQKRSAAPRETRSVIPALAAGISPRCAPSPVPASRMPHLRRTHPPRPSFPPPSVIPAQAGTQATPRARPRPRCPDGLPEPRRRMFSVRPAAPTAWVPACAGMTEKRRGGEQGGGANRLGCRTQRDTRGKRGYDGSFLARV